MKYTAVNSSTHTVQNRSAALFVAMMTALVFFALALFTPDVGAAMAPKDAVIGNQASATYIDNTATSRTSTSNLVQTIVSQVKSFTLTQTGMKSSSSNQQVCYPHSITNTGNGADTYTLNTPTTGGMFAHTGLAYFIDADQNGSPDNATAIVSSGQIGAGLTFNFVVCGTTSVSAAVGQQGTITVSATDTNTPTPTTQTRTDTTTIAAASISMQKKLSSVPPPGYTPISSGPSPNLGPLFVILEYTNNGAVQGDNMLITDALPSGWIYVPGSGRSSVTGAAILTDAPDGDGPAIRYSAPTTPTSGTIVATIPVVPAATSGNVYFQVTIAPDLAVTTSANQAVTTNTATYSYNYSYFNPITMLTQTVVVPTTSTNSVLYSVLRTAGVVANGSSTTTGITDSEPVTVATGSPGQVITWIDYIWNTGNGPDTFDISIANTPLNGSSCSPDNNAALGQCTFPTNTIFRVLSSGGLTPLLDTNSNSTPDTGIIPVPTAGACPAPYIVSTSLPRRCGYPIAISATIPVGATAGTNAGNGFQVLVGATSTFNTALTETVPNRLTAIVSTQPTLTKSFTAATVVAGSSTPLVFRLTNIAGNPVQAGLAFIDTLPSGLRLSTGATSTVVGAGCSATVTLTAPSTIAVTAGAMSLGTATCEIAVNGITNTAALNADCATNPAAFTNGQTSIGGLVKVTNGVTNQCLLVTPVRPTLTKTFTTTSIITGASTPLNFRLTNSAGNPAQTGITFIDTLPSGLRLASGATATVVGSGCAATVTLTAPSTINVAAGSMSLGTATCEIAVNGVTNTAALNADCSTNPSAFTNGPTAISGLVNVTNGVTNQCLQVTPVQPTLTKTFAGTSITAGASTPLNFRLTNSAGNPAQTGFTFIDTLPSGLRLTTGATATVVGSGCAATVTLTAPSTINIAAGSMSLGTATCDIAVNGVTNTAALNTDCSTNPSAFTNGPTAISGLVNVTNGVTNQCLQVTPVQPTLTKTFAGTSITAGASTPLNFRLTNSAGNPAQTGFTFVDMLPSGLRLTTGATATVVGAGCAATVTLTAPSTISVAAGSMSLGTATCDIAVNGVTNTAALNTDCSTNPSAFTNGPTSISGLVNVTNGVTNQCLQVTPVQPTLTKSFAATAIAAGGSTPLNFRLTNSAGNPAQTGIAFTDTLPSGLRLTAGATATVVGSGCAATVTLTAPSTISVAAGSMSLGTATCDLVVNGITNTSAANPDCSTNPAAFTNGQASISGLTGVTNGVTNQCLVVTPVVRVTAAPVCLNKAPYVDYTIGLVGASATAGVTIEWQKITGQTVSTLRNQPLMGRLLWPGAAVDANGVATEWPGYKYDGNFYQPVNDGLRPDIRIIFTVAGSNTVVVTYPDGDCNPPAAPPAKPNLDVNLIKWFSQYSGISPSGKYTVTLRYANSSVEGSDKTGVEVSDALPPGMTVVSGSLRVRPVPGGPIFALPGASGTTTINGSPATYATSASSISLIFSRLKRAEEGFIEFDVNIVSGIAVDTVLPNTAQVRWRDAAGVATGPRNSNTVEFKITGNEGVSLSGMTLPTADPGSTVVFENVLTNRGPRTDTFDITLSGSNYPAGTIFKLYKSDGITLLADTNSNGIADTGPVAAGAIYRIIVKAELPVAIVGGPYSIAKNAQSISNPLVRATDNDIVRTIARFCKVILEPNNEGRVNPGGMLAYKHFVTNVGNCVETITVPTNYLSGVVQGPATQSSAVNTLAGKAAAIPGLAAAAIVVQGWTAQTFMDNPVAGGQAIPGVLDAADAELTPTTTFTLQPGGSASFFNRVEAPLNAPNGSRNTTTVRINAGSSGTLSVNDVTTVALGSPPIIIDDITGFIDPGFQRPTVWGFIGKELYLRANAPSCNQDPTIIERRTIIITGPNGEREEIIATETGVNTGMFIADVISIRLPPVTASDGVLQGLPFDTYQVELVGCGKKIITSITLIDPRGVVFDSRTNQLIAGATVRMVTASGGVCTNTLASVSQLVMGQVVPAPNPVVTGTDGVFNFELVAPGDYCVLVTPPNGYTFVSRVPVSQLPAGRNVIATGPTTGGSYGGAFRVGPETGPVIVDIPVDGGAIAGLVVLKTVSRAVVEIGELASYAVVVSNRTGYALNQNDVFLTDTLPLGFTYVAGSARKDGKALADPQGGIGPRLVFNLGFMARDQSLTVTYRVRVGPGAMQGDGINRVVASYRVNSDSVLPGAGSTLYSFSNVATAKVEVVGGVFTDRAYIVGKIYTDCDNDGLQNADKEAAKSEVGIPGVRVVLEDGTSAITDSEGKYSFYGMSARTHVLKIDKTTLPAGVTVNDLAMLSGRNLGKPDSRIVDLKNGELHRANFAVKTCSEAALNDINKRRLSAIDPLREIEGRLQQKLETEANLRSIGDIKALPASGQVGLVAPVANIAAPASLGESSSATADINATMPKPPIRFDTLAIAQSEPTQKRVPSRAREPEVLLESLLPAEDNTIGFIGLNFGDVLPYAQTTIRVKGVAGTTFKLRVNDVEVGADRIGKKAILAEKSLQAWEFIGIELRAGENALSVTQFDEFGNARGEASIKVVAPGRLVNVNISYKGGTADGFIADGKTPAIVVVTLSDRNNVPVTSRVAIDLSSSVGRWNVEDMNPAETGLQTFVEGGRAEFELLPPSDPGQALVRVTSGDLRAEAKLDFLPDLRDLLAVGVIEGVLNLRKMDARGIVPARAQDGFEQEIKNFARSSSNGERDYAARAAMFLKGKVLGEYLMTMAYDSDKTTRERLFRDIQPDEFYPIYGDASVRSFDAQSTGRFYVRIDSKKSYLLYGDFNTSQATDARKLSNYSRSLTGVKQHFENSFISANVFASRDTTRQVIDEFRANGTSGPFTLSRSNGLTNSEKVEILTRDRNQPSIVVRAQPLLRFVDYELEPLTGRILLKAPVPSLDENLNPISIRVTYEVDQGGDLFWVIGADAQVKVTDNIEVGAVIVDDQNPVDKFRMLGVNAIAQLSTKTFLIAEVARTNRDTLAIALTGATLGAPLAGLTLGEKTGDAKRIELRHSNGDFEASLYAGRADVNFDNPSAALNRGRQEIGGKLAYRIDEKTRVVGEVLRTEDIVLGGQRDGALLTVERTLGNGIRVEAGVRHAKDNQTVSVLPVPNPLAATGLVNGVVVPNEVTTVRGRVTGEIPGVKDASAYVEAEVDVNDTSKKIAAVGGDYKIGSNGRIYARHEFITSLTGPYGLNNQQRQNSTILGISADYMKDGNVFSEYRIRDAIAGGDAEAALGLRNLWTLAPGLLLSTGFERVQSLAGKAEIEATSLTFGLEYTANPLWKGATRLELRTSSSSDSLLSTIGGAAKLSRDWTFLGRNTYSLIRNKGVSTGENEQDRLQLGVAYRDTETDVWNALGRVEHRTEHDTTLANIELKRTVELISIHANWQPRRPFTFSGRYAAKWVNDKSNGLTTKNNAQLLAGRALWDIAPRWDVGLNASTMFGRGTQSKVYGLGIELGFLVMENLWISGGYNFFGYRDEDIASGEYTTKGAFVRLRYKFDEDLFASGKSAKSTATKEANGVTTSADTKPTTGNTEPKGEI